MKLEVFNQILTMMHTYGSRDCLKAIALQYPGVTYNTLVSIYSQDYQKKTRKNHHKHHKSEVMESYYKRLDYFISNLYIVEGWLWMIFGTKTKRYLAGVAQDSGEPVLLRIAEEVDLSHSLLARIVLERHLSHSLYNGESPPKGVVGQAMKDPLTLIQDKTLAHEVHQCILNDPNYGPLMDNIKRIENVPLFISGTLKCLSSVGYEYEFILREKLQNRGIPFLGEDEMRSRGYDKTPDCKLEIPIAVDGLVVNWIESKASFGDEYNHQTYLKDQFWSYWNRFGPGMVIYWFGFIDELDCNRERGIILKDDFPTDIITLDSLLDP